MKRTSLRKLLTKALRAAQATTVPVSYTHLDVYKRQDLAACALRGRRTSPVETGLGAIIVSGESEGVLLSTRAWVFKPATFQILDGGTISKGRRGAVVLPLALIHIWRMPAHALRVDGLYHLLADHVGHKRNRKTGNTGLL